MMRCEFFIFFILLYKQHTLLSLCLVFWSWIKVNPPVFNIKTVRSQMLVFTLQLSSYKVHYIWPIQVYLRVSKRLNSVNLNLSYDTHDNLFVTQCSKNHFGRIFSKACDHWTFIVCQIKSAKEGHTHKCKGKQMKTKFQFIEGLNCHFYSNSRACLQGLHNVRFMI